MFSRGDLVWLPVLARSFRGLQDLTETVRCWHDRGVRVYVSDLRLDTATPDGLVMLEFAERLLALQQAAKGDESKRRVRGPQRSRFHGHPPWGLQVVGPKGNRRYEAVAEDLVVGRKIVEWRLAGHTFRAIWLHLWQSGVPRWVGNPKGRRQRADWTIEKVVKAYRCTLRIEMMLAQGKATLPRSLKRGQKNQAAQGAGAGQPGGSRAQEQPQPAGVHAPPPAVQPPGGTPGGLHQEGGG